MEITNKIDNKTYTNITKGRIDKKGIAWQPDVIVCHITEGSYAGAVSWLQNPEAKASAHFVVSKKGEITQLVDLKDTAWSNGTSYTPITVEGATAKLVKERSTNANAYTISIEHEGVYTDGNGALTVLQEKATVFLIKHINKQLEKIYGRGIKFDRDHIIGHYEISPKAKPNCPGKKYPFDDIIKKLNESEVDNEMVTNTDILIDGKRYNVNRILKDGKNYIEMREFEKAGYKIGYKSEEKLPTFNK